MITKIERRGQGGGIRLPRELPDAASLDIGDIVTVDARAGRL